MTTDRLDDLRVKVVQLTIEAANVAHELGKEHAPRR
jgi:hypothetical protein